MKDTCEGCCYLKSNSFRSNGHFRTVWRCSNIGSGISERKSETDFPEVPEWCPVKASDEEGNFIDKITDNLKLFLKEKNKRYGNSALQPLDIFKKHLKHQDKETKGILIRLDDKISRIQNANELRKNDIVDVLGYLVLLCHSKKWHNFSDLID